MTPHSTPCENAAPALSALLDDELSHVDRLEAVDHLVACAACRRFYRDARTLDSWTTLLDADGGEEPLPADGWQRTAAALAPAAETEAPIPVSTTSAGPRRAWLPSLAAMALLAFGLWLTQTIGRPALDAGFELRLEEARGHMTDERFVALTTEVLRADRRYHHKMLEVMTVVAERTQRSEGTVGDARRRDEASRSHPERDAPAGVVR